MNAQQIGIDNAMVVWSIGARSDYQAIVDGLTALQLEKLAPNRKTDNAVLRESLADTYPGTGVMIRALQDRDGFTVVQEKRGHTENDYANEAHAKMNGIGPKLDDFQDYNGDRQRQLTERFAYHMKNLARATVGALLVKCVYALHGTSCRDAGGAYWIPASQVSKWEAIARVIEGAAVDCSSLVSTIRIRTDAEALRMVSHALREEAAQALAEIEEELTRDDITERGVKGQLKRAKELRAKLREYEKDLNISLQDVHGKIDQAEQEQATAALFAASSGASVPSAPIPTGKPEGAAAALFPFMA